MVTISSVGTGLLIVGAALSITPLLLNRPRSWMTVTGGLMLIAGLVWFGSEMTAASF